MTRLPLGPAMPCRACRAPVTAIFVDLGDMPLANEYPLPSDSPTREKRYPLRARVCENCWLVQLDHDVSPQEIFSEYAYFSSYSDTWMQHAEQFALSAMRRWSLDRERLVIEIASNDGYLLKHFASAGIPVLGVEPAENVATVARQEGIETRTAFFGRVTAAEFAAEGRRGDLIVANNVLAHVPDLADFVAGIPLAMKEGGVASVEFPHFLRLLTDGQFDTIYHEHFSYLSLLAVERAFADAGLRVFEVTELVTHGGSLRVFAELADGTRPEGGALARVREDERRAGLSSLSAYIGFADRVDEWRRSMRAFFDQAAADGCQVVGYGAAAKGNTLLNVCGATTADVAYVVDRNPYKQGRLLPGTRIPVFPPNQIEVTKPDYVLILPWNLRSEITRQMASIRDWGGKFVVPIPEPVMLP